MVAQAALGVDEEEGGAVEEIIAVPGKEVRVYILIYRRSVSFTLAVESPF